MSSDVITRATALRAFDATAVRTSVDLLDQATDADLSRPTPCAGWTLRDLLAHMTVQHYGFAAAARGDGDLANWRREPGDDPIAEYVTAAEHVVSVFADDTALTRVFPLPEFTTAITFPADQAISFHFIDYVVHSWDVARTLGRTVEFGQSLLDAALVVARAVPADDKARLRPNAAFAPPVAWPGESTLDQILAVLGRSPHWPDR
jgi:uncharacterized protein (TIGR03086 family)